MMRIVAAGASHASAPFEVLERVSVPPAQLDAAHARLKEIAVEGFILSTCNRTEIYALLPADSAPEGLLRFLAARSGEKPEALSAAAYVYSGDSAVRHALRVASGLDSMALGEDQIQAQFKRALNAARAVEALGPQLERLGATALGCGKRVRAFTGIGRHALSLESIAVDQALIQTPVKAAARAVVIGSGSSATLVLRRLGDRGVRHISVVGRTPGRADALAETTGAQSVEWELLPELLASANVVFSCTSAPHPVLTPDTLAYRNAIASAPAMTCVDLGMPRDIDPAVTTMPGVSLIALDSLARVAESRRAERAHHVPAAEAIVDREAARFRDWLIARDKSTDIIRVRAQAEEVATAEVRRALARMPGLAARERAVVTTMARRIAGQLAHRHTDAIKHASEFPPLAEEVS